jgi:hypothetical protein
VDERAPVCACTLHFEKYITSMKPSWVLESPMHHHHITVDQNSADVASDGDTGGLHPNQITFYAPITTGVDLTVKCLLSNP